VVTFASKVPPKIYLSSTTVLPDFLLIINIFRHSTAMNQIKKQQENIRLDTISTSTVLQYRVLVKIKRDLIRDEKLLVTVAASTLSFRIPHLASQIQKQHHRTSSIEGLHPTQLLHRRRTTDCRRFETSDKLLELESRDIDGISNGNDDITHRPRLFTIKESYDEE
jgi:hypothetical protein